MIIFLKHRCKNIALWKGSDAINKNELAQMIIQDMKKEPAATGSARKESEQHHEEHYSPSEVYHNGNQK